MLGVPSARVTGCLTGARERGRYHPLEYGGMGRFAEAPSGVSRTAMAVAENGAPGYSKTGKAALSNSVAERHCGFESRYPDMSNSDERFWSKVNKTKDCWTWTSAMNQGGYGVFWKDRRSQLAHRIAYEMAVGPIPDGMFLDHMCHNRACVNPSHLRIVTRKQNQENLLGPNSRSTSGYRGVRRNHNGWAASVVHEQRTHHLGTFPSPDLAAEAARLKRLELFTHNDADRT